MPRASPYPTAAPFLPEKLTLTALRERAGRARTLVLLGATAAQACLGKEFRLTQHRGEALDSDLAELVTATIHPSAVLRGEDRDALFAGLVDDLRIVATFGT